MRKFLIFMMLITAFTGCLNANATDLLLGGFSYHFEKPDPEFDEPEKFNESNELIGVKFDWLAVTAMKNSYYKNSYSVLFVGSSQANENIDLLLVAGVASGYQDSQLKNIDGVAGVVYVGADFHPKSDKFGIVLTVAPGSFASVNFRLKL